MIKELKSKHNNTYTPMQYHIWVEVLIAGLHSSTDEPPTTSMFTRAGGASSNKKVAQGTKMLSQTLKGGGENVNYSPGKVIDSRTKCYKQLSDLKNLLESGILSLDEYECEKEVILSRNWFNFLTSVHLLIMIIRNLIFISYKYPLFEI